MANKPKLLVLTNGFPDIKGNKYNCHFVYEYAKLVQEDFDEITVISPQPIFPKFLQRIPYLNRFARFSNFKNYCTGNIRVYYPSFITFPLPFFRDRNHKSFESKILDTIKKGNVNFDLIHAHFLYPTGLAALKIKKDYKKQLVLTLHGGDIYSWPFLSKQHLAIAMTVLSQTDYITSPSSVIDKNINKILPSSLAKTHRISNFIDTNKFFIKNQMECRKKLNLPKDKKIILNVANITDGKGHQDLLEAFVGLKNNKEYVCYIVGQGELEKALRRQIAKHRLEKNFFLVGPRSNTDLVDWYNTADIFVFPSYYESFGIAQIEAMACGLPVVAYNNEGSKEIVNNSDVGFLVPAGNTNQLTLNIEKAIKKQWNKNVIREHVLENYSEIVAKKKLLNIYKKSIF